MECNQHRSKSSKKKLKHIETSRLSTVDRVHVAHSAPVSTEELSTFFLKGSSSVLVVFEGGRMSVETNTAGSSLMGIGQSMTSRCHMPTSARWGVELVHLKEAYHLVQRSVQKAFGTPDRLLICCASFFDSLVELIQFHLQCDVLIERIVPVSKVLFSFVRRARARPSTS